MSKKKAKNPNPYAKPTKKKPVPWPNVVAIVLVIAALAFAAVRLINGRIASKQEAAAQQFEFTRTTPTDYVEIEVADYGTIKAELFGNMAPITVNNFLNLVKEGFYDGLTFHRIISGFMIQGGDPKGNGTGGSSETIKGEFSSNGYNNTLLHTRGILSMARSSDPNSASSQFFIVHQDSPHLNGNYAAFGKVIEGMEIVDAICEKTPVQDSNGKVAPADQPVITAIRIVDNNVQ